MIRPITIQAVLNGYVVTVGCQTLAYETRNSMLHDLNNYLENPEKTEGYFMVSALNAKHIMTGPAQPGNLGGQPMTDPVMDRRLTAEMNARVNRLDATSTHYKQGEGAPTHGPDIRPR